MALAKAVSGGRLEGETEGEADGEYETYAVREGEAGGITDGDGDLIGVEELVGWEGGVEAGGEGDTAEDGGGEGGGGVGETPARMVPQPLITTLGTRPL